MYDLIIVGSGPAGLSAAIYGVRAGLNLIVVEQSAVSGGQILNTYEVDNYPGMRGISGDELAKRFRGHADALGVAFRVGKVLEVEDMGTVKKVRTQREEWETKTVIVATGARYAKLKVPGEEALSGRGVSYCATCDGAFYKGLTVAVVGGGDAALEDAIYLAGICEKVYLIHRREELRGAAILQEELRGLSNVEILYRHVVKEIHGTETVDTLTLQEVPEGAEKQLDVNGIFIAVGILPETELLRELAKQDEQGYILAGEDGSTGCPGIFTAGDIRRKPLRQIVTAVADGANAAISAVEYCKK
ncbi:MAG: thioredoxin-disulfide reductase [Lachnospiraceae bacterium]|nr:thioredoxin-disulfide reductase [Lachnospiraceae bacterium]